MNNEILRIEHLRKTYADVTPLRDINLTVRKGDVIAIIGPSGTGKSTLLRLINRMETATAGCIFFGEEEITSSGCRIDSVRQKIGMIFQSFNLFPHLTVIENIIAAPVALKRIDKQTAYDNAKILLAKVGLESKIFAYPNELSGGQQQRIAIVRALAMEPEILLLDEPTSALDPTMVGEVETVIKQVAQSGVTMMIVTHGMDFARNVANRVIYLDAGEVYEDGTPEDIFEKPQRERTRQFIRKLKVLTLNIESKDFDFLEYAANIDSFGRNNGIPRSLVYGLQLFFEELCLQILLPHLKNFAEPRIRWAAEYSPDQGYAELRVDYNGGSFDINGSDNELALRILKKRAEQLTYKYDATTNDDTNAALSNHVYAKIVNM